MNVVTNPTNNKKTTKNTEKYPRVTEGELKLASFLKIATCHLELFQSLHFANIVPATKATQIHVGQNMYMYIVFQFVFRFTKCTLLYLFLDSNRFYFVRILFFGVFNGAESVQLGKSAHFNVCIWQRFHQLNDSINSTAHNLYRYIRSKIDTNTQFHHPDATAQTIQTSI